MPIAVQNAQASSSRRGPTTQRTSRRQVSESAQDEEADGVDERPRTPKIIAEDGWTKATYEDRPIVKDGPTLETLKALKNNIETMKRGVEEMLERHRGAAKDVETCSPDDELITEIESDFLRLLDIKATLDIRIEVVDALSLKLRQNQGIDDGTAAWKRETKAKEDEYKSQTARGRFKKCEGYINFRTTIWEVNHDHEAMPPITTWLPQEEGDEDDDEEFEMGGTTQNYRCPLTLMAYSHAVTSSKCGHHFSRDAILSYIETAKGKSKAKCPNAGCNAILTKADLKDDPALQKRTDEAEKRKQRREEEAEDDEDRVDIT